MLSELKLFINIKSYREQHSIVFSNNKINTKHIINNTLVMQLKMLKNN